MRCLIGLLLLWASCAHAGDQAYEVLSASVKAVLQQSVSDESSPHMVFNTPEEGMAWLTEMSKRLKVRMPDDETRTDFLKTVQYEASRAGLDPQLVLALIQVESNFRKYAVSNAGARGYMQVMPFWVGEIGAPEQDLFQLRTNLRYGCTILRYYLDVEHGDLFRALGRYNGSLGRPDYPQRVSRAWHGQWAYRQRIAEIR
jgi:soluble lytic murein transglycosylase-like protein